LRMPVSARAAAAQQPFHCRSNLLVRLDLAGIGGAHGAQASAWTMPPLRNDSRPLELEVVDAVQHSGSRRPAARRARSCPGNARLWMVRRLAARGPASRLRYTGASAPGQSWQCTTSGRQRSGERALPSSAAKLREEAEAQGVVRPVLAGVVLVGAAAPARKAPAIGHEQRHIAPGQACAKETAVVA